METSASIVEIPTSLYWKFSLVGTRLRILEIERLKQGETNEGGDYLRRGREEESPGEDEEKRGAKRTRGEDREQE